MIMNELFLPIVVRTVPEKNTAWPKLQFGSTVKLVIAEIPRLFASTIRAINASRSVSEMNE